MIGKGTFHINLEWGLLYILFNHLRQQKDEKMANLMETLDIIINHSIEEKNGYLIDKLLELLANSLLTHGNTESKYHIYTKF